MGTKIREIDLTGVVTGKNITRDQQYVIRNFSILRDALVTIGDNINAINTFDFGDGSTEWDLGDGSTVLNLGVIDV